MSWLHRGALATGLALAALAPFAGTAQAQESAVVKRATQLRDTPAESGASVAPLAANTVVTRSSERKGPWTKVSTPQGASGWVHMFDLGPQAGSASGTGNAATGGLRSLGGLFGGNSGSTTTATSTVGIRGLDAQDIQCTAQPGRSQPSRRPAGPCGSGPQGRHHRVAAVPHGAATGRAASPHHQRRIGGHRVVQQPV